MKRIIYFLIFILLLVSSCKNEKESNIILDETIIMNCFGKSLKLYLPKGFGIPDRVEEYTGFFQTYTYPDKSALSIMCDSTSVLEISKDIEYRGFTREEKINDISFIYWNVTTERKAEFDFAFDKMKAE